MNRFSLFFAASVGVSLWTNPGRAVCVPSPFAACPSDSIQITDGLGNIINDINGNPASGSIPENTSEGTASAILNFNFAVPFPSPQNTVVFLTETAQANLAPISDQVNANSIITPLGPGTEIVFFSDDDASTPFPCQQGGPGTCIVETGQPQDVTAFLFPGVSSPPFHVIVQSDPPEVPEPGTILLLSSGLAGLAVIGARRQRV
jgi:hypothetical protein